jgi:hypothetical protein
MPSRKLHTAMIERDTNIIEEFDPNIFKIGFNSTVCIIKPNTVGENNE